MLRPSTAPVWATASVYATSNDPSAVGEPTKNDPSSISAQGWDYATRPDPTHFNFWQNAVGVWLDWAKDHAFGDDGGSYTLDNYLTLQGNGLTVATSGELTITSDSFFYLNGAGTVTATGSLALVSGAELNLASGSDIIGNPTFSGGTWTWASPQVVDTTTLSFAGTGHIRDRGTFALNTSGAQTVGINNGDEFVVPLLSGTLNVTLSTTGAGTGSRMRFTAHANIASGFSAVIVTPEGTYNMRADTGGTYYSSLDVKFYGGAWHTSVAVLVP